MDRIYKVDNILNHNILDHSISDFPTIYIPGDLSAFYSMKNNVYTSVVDNSYLYSGCTTQLTNYKAILGLFDTSSQAILQGVPSSDPWNTYIPVSYYQNGSVIKWTEKGTKPSFTRELFTIEGLEYDIGYYLRRSSVSLELLNSHGREFYSFSASDFTDGVIPTRLFAVVQGGGGAGGSSDGFTSGGGGGSGALFYGIIDISVCSPSGRPTIKLIPGRSGKGEEHKDGTDGGASKIEIVRHSGERDNITILSVRGGHGGGANWAGGGTSGDSDEVQFNDLYVYSAGDYKRSGVAGGAYNQGSAMPSLNLYSTKDSVNKLVEPNCLNLPSRSGGTSPISYGGGGGASCFAPGGNGGDTASTGKNGSLGSGGGGGTFTFGTWKSGGNGGPGFIRLYY